MRVAREPRTEQAGAAATHQAPDDLAAAAGELSTAEWACLELAWQALLAGTTPVGAVVTDSTGAIVSTGRNAVYGAADPPLVSGSLLAHAEVNALIWLRLGRRHPDLRLVTSLGRR